MRNRKRTTGLLVFAVLVFLPLSVLHAADGQEPNGEAPGKKKDWSIVYSYIHLKTVSGDTYDIQSPGANYYTRNRWKVPLITSTSIFVPVAISYDDVYFNNLLDYYTSAIGIEFMMGMEWSGRWNKLWEWGVAPGWNVNMMSLPGKVGYYPFQSFTSGPALNFVVSRDWEQGISVRFGIYSSYQFIDFIHSADKLKHGYSLQLALGLSFREGSAFGRVRYE